MKRRLSSGNRLIPNVLCLALLTLGFLSPAANAQANEWAWMGGSSTTADLPGVYGTLGQPAAGNIPGSRGGAVTWTDKNGNLWLFGGLGYDSAGTYGALNDLWEFDPALGANGEWAWMGGSNTLPRNLIVPGVYGTLGTPAAGNIPGNRSYAVTWTDSGGNLWLFGGVVSVGPHNLKWFNDLWEFNPMLGTNGEWAWMGGSSTEPITCAGSTYCGPSGVYGALGTPAAGNIPGSRSSEASWTDASGNLWLFGGGGFDSTGADGTLNDLWEFNPTLGSYGEWAWMGGSSTVGRNYSQPGVYGRWVSPLSETFPDPEQVRPVGPTPAATSGSLGAVATIRQAMVAI